MQDIKDRFRAVPFGNSVFQIQYMVANQDTPERSYRAVLLQYDQKSRAMRSCSFQRRRLEIDLREIEEKLSRPDLTKYDRARLEVDRDEKLDSLESQIKLIEDCAIEMRVYEDILNKMPEFTREEFESGERTYWKKRLIADAERDITSSGTISAGTLDALKQIGCPAMRSADGKFVIADDRSDILIWEKPKEVKDETKPVNLVTSRDDAER